MNLFEVFDRIEVGRSLAVVFLGTFVVGNIAFQMKEMGVRDGFARKFNHFGLSLLSVVFLFDLSGDSFIYTSIFTSLCVVLIYAFSALSGLRIVASIICSNVRERDQPRGKFFVFLPLISGQVAIYGALVLIDPLYAKVAFCSMGLGDGLAEPVGLRYGKNTYRVFDPLWRVWNTKSLQGSLAVFLVSIFCCSLALLFGESASLGASLVMGLLYATVITIVEAIAPRGLDNMLIIAIGSTFLHFAMA